MRKTNHKTNTNHLLRRDDKRTHKTSTNQSITVTTPNQSITVTTPTNCNCQSQSLLLRQTFTSCNCQIANWKNRLVTYQSHIVFKTDHTRQSTQNGLLASEDTDDNRYWMFSGLRTGREKKSIQLAEHYYCCMAIYRLNDSRLTSLDLFLNPLFSTCLTNTTKKKQERPYIHAKLSEWREKQKECTMGFQVRIARKKASHPHLNCLLFHLAGELQGQLCRTRCRLCSPSQACTL